jgi:hypothetical protein
MINYLVLVIVLFYFIISSYEDFKKREVYDYYNFSFTFLIILIGIFHSFYIENFEPLKYVFFGLIVGFILGSILYLSGLWGGGDSKFLIGFSASSYYLLDFVNFQNIVENTIRIKEIFNYFINLFLGSFLDIVLFVDFIFLLLVFFLGFIFYRNKKEFKSQILLFLILFLLFSGLYLNYSNLSLAIIGFLVFVLIFFGPEDMFDCVYFRYKKRILDLKDGDILDKNLTIGNKKLFNEKENYLYLIGKYHLNKLKKLDDKFKKKLVEVRKPLPYSILISLNFLLYLFYIVNLDGLNLEIIVFNIIFILFSFFVGGIITLLLIFFLAIFNFKKIKLHFSKFEKLLVLVLLFISFVFTLINFKFIVLFLIVLFYFMIKVSKEVERIAFVSKKKIENIVPGDWIVEDVVINGNKYFEVEDFKLGVDFYQLEKIQSLAKKYKDFKELLVKDGIAFIPPMFLTFIILLFIKYLNLF